MNCCIWKTWWAAAYNGWEIIQSLSALIAFPMKNWERRVDIECRLEVLEVSSSFDEPHIQPRWQSNTSLLFIDTTVYTINAPDDKTALAEERMHVWPEISSTVILCAVCWMANSCLTLCNPWTVACQTPLSGFSKQEYWNGLTFPPSGDLSNPGIKPAFLVSPALAGRFFITEPPGKPSQTSF